MEKKYRIPAAILAAVLVGGGLYSNFHETPKPVEKKVEQPKPIQGFGVIDLDEVKANHPDGGLLEELLSREKRLNLELDALLIPYQKPKDLEPPKIEEKPFNDSAREKNAQSFISQMAELRAKKNQLTEKYRRESREEYLRRRDEVTSVYFNRALNITLKLQNADNLGLSAAEIKELQTELDELVAERNQKQGEMLAKWTAEINERVEKEIAPEETRIKEEAKQNLQKLQEEAQQKIQETQQRNLNLMETATKEIEARQIRRKEILEELTEVTKERALIENKILDYIAEEAGKLGAMLKLEAIFLKSRHDDEKLFKEDKFDFTLKKSPGAMIYIGKDTPDLTNDIIKSMKLKTN
ncbi:MAG: hypothetical protein IK062_02450 [Selenomonadaceae bacterium]|nr:hypothetical protein [Selenomonadaceae bacterium]